MDLTSKPLSPWKADAKQRQELRLHLMAAADALRMDGRLLKAESTYRLAARYTDTGPGAVEHIIRLADHCRQIYDAKKRRKLKKQH